MSRPPPTPLPKTDDPYVLLDVRPGASPDQIRRAYLRRVKTFKPDRYPAEFRRVREAYDRLREQEAWFDAWRQANDVVRQAVSELQDAEGEADPGQSNEESSVADDGTANDGNATHHADGGPAHDPSAEAHATSQAGAAANEPTNTPAPAVALHDASSVTTDESAIDEPHLVADGSPPATSHDHQPEDDDDEPSVVLLEEASVERRRRASREVDSQARLDRLTATIHAALIADRTTEAATLLLSAEAELLATQPDFTPLLLEVSCALVWAAPALFDEVVSRYGDLIATIDTEYREGALLHRRTLTDEVAGWHEAVADWPQLQRFVALGASLRAPDEAELGLHLGQRAAAEPNAFLAVLLEAGRNAPGIVALYVGMAERWAQRYGRAVPGTAPSPSAPSLDDAATALAHEIQTHRVTRWEQLYPVVCGLVIIAIIVLSNSPWIELSFIGVFVVLWSRRAWRGDPLERLYVRVVQPAAATWLWAAGVSPNELAIALQARLPVAGTWDAIVHPTDCAQYPDLLGNDLTLLAFGVTAPMIPTLGRRGGTSAS
ncbi:MAG: hypothetical protein K0V04_22160 [Deltaproteobacteria bacterium]|nr:hypothetical protein [Deltaproteobacteria bacterium]